MFVSFIARLIALTCKCTTLNKFFPELMGLNRCPGFPYWKWTRAATFAQEAVHLWELSCKLWETTLSPNLTIARQPLFKKIYKNHRTPPVPTIRYCIGLIREVKWKKKASEEIITSNLSLSVASSGICGLGYAPLLCIEVWTTTTFSLFSPVHTRFKNFS